jgi:hypothetical protein
MELLQIGSRSSVEAEIRRPWFLQKNVFRLV